MKTIESSNSSVTIKISRTEFENLSKALCMAFYMLVGARDGGVVKLTDHERKIGAAFSRKIQNLLRHLTRIAIQKGWLPDDDEEEDIDA
jgi:hypothetical protein